MMYVQSARVIVADPDSQSRASVRAVLEPAGCLIEECANGPQALERIAGADWDLLLLAASMPEMSGFEALRRVRENHTMVSLPVIMMTTYDAAQGRARALELNANDFLTKPVDPPELLARVSSIISMRRAQMELTEKLKELAELDEWKQALLTALTRDIRRLLSSAKTDLDMMAQRDPGWGPDVAVSLDKSLSAIRRAVELTDSVADSSGSQDRLLTQVP